MKVPKHKEMTGVYAAREDQGQEVGRENGVNLYCG